MRSWKEAEGLVDYSFSDEVLPPLLVLLYFSCLPRKRRFFSGCLSFRNLMMVLEVTSVSFMKSGLTLSIQEE